MEKFALSVKQKALALNLNDSIYGSFAEIGAGQEVARTFFQSGGASGTIARTISAYDMAVSDSIYGKTPDGRYVSEERLKKMLDFEFSNIVELLGKTRHENTCFFAFASTVSALNFKKDNYSHGWMGIKYQLQPNSAPNEIVIHFRLWENDNILQQRTVGIIGVNLIYSAFHYSQNPQLLLQSLMDFTSFDQVSVDMIMVKGPELSYIDNRLLAVQLVKNGMTDVAMFDRNGAVQHPWDLLYKKNVMVIRGSFRPITYVGFDMLKTGYHLLKEDVDFEKNNTLALCEITMDNLFSQGKFDERDFLDRVDILCGMGQNVMISNFREYYRLVNYLSLFKTLSLRLLIGAETFLKVIDEKYYSTLKGGILEAFGRLFISNLKVYLYPALQKDGTTLFTSANLPVDDKIRFLYEYLLSNKKIIDITGVKTQWLSFYSHDVLNKIKQKNPDWEKMVPNYVSRFIKEKKIFGYDA